MNTPRRLIFRCIPLAALLLAFTLSSSAKADEKQHEFFEKEVRPLLVKHCYECHSGESKKLRADLLLDRHEGFLKGGDSGAAIVAGKPDESLLIESIRYESFEMPPRGKMSNDEINVLVRWVKEGAYWPKDDKPATTASNREVFNLKERKDSHWVWNPIEKPNLPKVKDKQWPSQQLDHFILSKLEENQLQPAKTTDRQTLIRRLYFDLIGLPPTPEQLETYLSDTSKDATARLVDQLLASPHFGERWGRHWLDLVRYAESRGHEFDNDAPNAYQYRDYVIRAFNEDVPYDKFVTEHIAGDLIPTPRLNSKTGANESILGTGFWFLGEWVHSPVEIKKDETDRFDNMIDVMSKTFLGMTVSCARCHDHKFDAISTVDYYSLCGFLQSSNYRQVRFETIDKNKVVAEKLELLKHSTNGKILTQLKEFIGNDIEKIAADFFSSADKQGITESIKKENVIFDANDPNSFFRANGYSFGVKPVRTGEIQIEGETKSFSLNVATQGHVKRDKIWDDLKNLSSKVVNQKNSLRKYPRAGKTFRTDTFELKEDSLSYEIRGACRVFVCVDSHRLVHGPLHSETVRAFPITKGTNKRWVSQYLKRYRGHRIHVEFTTFDQSPLEVYKVIQGSPPKPVSNGEQPKFVSLEDYTKTIRNVLQKIDAPNSNFTNLEASALSELLKHLSQNSDFNSRIKPIIENYFSQRTKLKSEIIETSHTAPAMMDGNGEDHQVLIRGSYSNPGPLAPRRFLEAISGAGGMSPSKGSGRLELAATINAPNNPLSSRVIVNRLWHHLLGKGIVASTDNFGVLGLRPTHEKLLDHLAIRFREKGQSIKSMIKEIVLSSTYQMSSQIDSSAYEKDPKNLLWHHVPVKRLQGEIIRDALLAISGELKPTLHGQSIPVHLTHFMTGRGRPRKSGPVDGVGRRSIYLEVRRNFLSPMFAAFDTPPPFSAMGRRNVSNVPAQSLILLNDPFVLNQAKKWTDRAFEMHPKDHNARIEWLYTTAFSRTPDESEVKLATLFLKLQSELRNTKSGDKAIWTDLAHSLINTKEFIFLR